MKYEIKRIGRTVDLDDEILKMYREYMVLRDNPFAIVARSQFGHNPTKEEISDEELSALCNEVMLSELKTIEIMPKISEFLEKNYEKWTDGTMQEVEITT